MKRYPEYKESDAEWIGEMPSRWNLSMLKYMARLVYGDTLISENRENGVVPVYGSNGIIDVHSSANTLSPAIIVGRKGSLGKIQYSDVPCFVIDTAYFIDRRTSHVNLRWLHYVLQVLKLERFRDSVIPGLKREYAEIQHIPLITEEEQIQIANFLDRKTGQIDELIRIKERRIELLQEQRTALINQAVTKGLDPTVEMKPSEVEWIGEIPKHWVAKKLRYFCSMKSGNGFSHDLQGRIGLEIPFFKVADTNTPENKVEMLYAQNMVSSQDVSNFKFILHKPDSIVFPKVGAALLLNKRNILTQKSCIDNNMMSLYSDQSNYKFLYYAMLNVDFKRHYRAGGTVPSINESEVGNIPVAYPTISEQAQIANFLDRKTQQIDELIAAEGRKIELLKEYRQSLISEAVTGKIDVRNEV